LKWFSKSKQGECTPQPRFWMTSLLLRAISQVAAIMEVMVRITGRTIISMWSSSAGGSGVPVALADMVGVVDKVDTVDTVNTVDTVDMEIGLEGERRRGRRGEGVYRSDVSRSDRQKEKEREIKMR